jgi:hypothetical protein
MHLGIYIWTLMELIVLRVLFRVAPKIKLYVGKVLDEERNGKS